MFDIGEYVSYRAEGVCRIEDIRVENFGTLAKDVKYYILTPVAKATSTFFVPVDNDHLVSMMRRLLGADEICQLVERVSKRELDWIEDGRQRNARFKEILSLGEREELVLLVRTVSRRIEQAERDGGKVYVTDINAQKRALELLFGEFSLSLPFEDIEALRCYITGADKKAALC